VDNPVGKKEQERGACSVKVETKLSFLQGGFLVERFFKKN